jgi:hypothetical protein
MAGSNSDNAAAGQGLELSYPGVWNFAQGDGAILIFTSDEQFLTCAYQPDTKIENLLTYDEPISLREICRKTAAEGKRWLIVSYDFFFGGSVRKLFPDEPECRRAYKAIYDVCREHGVEMIASVLSPLDLGHGYVKTTGEYGRWLQYQEGYRDPATGYFRVEVELQKQWFNNKGPVPFEFQKIRVFAFKEKRIPDSIYFVVRPESIREITSEVSLQEVPGSETNVGSIAWSADKHISARTIITGTADVEDGEEYDRVFAVLYYRLPEMDYFSPRAGEFLRDHLQEFKNLGVIFDGFYSDEPHIQGDGCHFRHFGPAQLSVRYVSEWFERKFAERYGSQYADFAPWLIYFAQAQHRFIRSIDAEYEAQHVMGESPSEIAKTMLLRQQYYTFLQGSVVDLMVGARKHAQELFDRPMWTRGHTTWAEPPTLDVWTRTSEPVDKRGVNYEYTSDFLASNTVHEAASATYDYFRWNEFLTGMGNDTAEGGYADRNYYACALACSTGVLNEYPYAYCSFWGLPKACAPHMKAIRDTFGTSASDMHLFLQESQHREIEPLFVWPLDLVAVDERFGSWMTQYSYANYITAYKLLEMGHVEGGEIVLKDRRYNTLVVLYEPFPSEELINFLESYAKAGGTIVWSSVPPIVGQQGTAVSAKWGELFGLSEYPANPDGLAVPGYPVNFEGTLGKVSPMPIITHFRVDRIWDVVPSGEVEVVARCKGKVVGVRKQVKGGGATFYLGFRPRDDQSGSSGENLAYWFDILSAVGAYPPSGKFDTNDNPTVLSRTTPYLCCRFPNGAVSICRHYKDHEENYWWGFIRDDAQDEEILRKNPLPSRDLDLDGFRVSGHSVSYSGLGTLSFRVAEDGRLIAFSGEGSTGITVDGRSYTFSDRPVEMCFCPVPTPMLPDVGYAVQIRAESACKLTIPIEPSGLRGKRAWMDAGGHGKATVQVPVTFGGTLSLEITPEMAGKWVYLV